MQENTVVGVQYVDYISKKTNQPVKGRTIFFTYIDSKTEGIACDKLYISDYKFGDVSLKPGDKFVMYYNKFGKVDWIVKNK